METGVKGALELVDLAKSVRKKKAAAPPDSGPKGEPGEVSKEWTLAEKLKTYKVKTGGGIFLCGRRSPRSGTA